MKTIGLYGGIGAGKSLVARILKEDYSAYHIEMDALGHRLMEQGSEVYYDLVGLLGVEILNTDGQIDRAVMANKIFADERLRFKVNEIIHPAVLSFTKRQLQINSNSDIPITVVETALPNEARLRDYCDTIWYVTADEKVRITRLKTDRGYSDEKIRSILNAQISEEGPSDADVVIDNSSDIDALKIQIKEALRRG